MICRKGKLRGDGGYGIIAIMTKKPLDIHTDGACSGNQHAHNVGGWGGVLEYGGHTKKVHGGERNTTNNRMEMKALISAFAALNRDGLFIRVFSDSSYLMDCFRKKWYVNWQRNGWLNAKKQPVENRDLWELLLPQIDKHKIEFYRVKGHISISSGDAKLKPVFKKFKEWNGDSFTYEDFLHITEMNNLADELANIGIDENR
jgi:ribonuclease HI